MTTLNQIKQAMHQVIVGKDEVIDYCLVALLSSGHVLIEDVPGIGKTTLVQALAKSLNLTFKRIQFTPDLMPSDITGFNYYNPKVGEFIFQKGLIMHQIILADEINRTSPKTQSALLEAMQENQVSIEGKTLPLEQPFMVLATQNPLDQVGTYPLPEAQLDRFMLKIKMDYPTKSEELDILDITDTQESLNQLQPIVSTQELLQMKQEVTNVHGAQPIKEMIVELVNATRNHPDLLIGASPRASQALLKASKAYAYIKGRDYVIPDDVMKLAPLVLSHRLTIKPEKRHTAKAIDVIVSELVKTIKV